MHWFKRGLWQIGIAIAGMLLLVGVPLSAVSAHEGTSGLATKASVTVQTMPTVDATVTALNKEQLTQQVAGQQHTWGNWLWSNAATILSSVLSTLVIVIGALVGLWRWRKDQHTELEKRAEERFQAAVTGLGDEKEGARVGAAILLRTFLRPSYEQFYTQVFDLAVANLRLPREAVPPDGDPDTPLPLTTLRQALIVVFKEAFPLARSLDRRDPQSLDASRIQLDNAYLVGADLKQAWLPQAFLRKADLIGAHLEGAHLNGINLSEARLRETHLEGANLFRANLSNANLSNANLSGSYLNGAHLNGTHFDGAVLRGADLSGTHLNDTDLSKADLRDTNLHRVKGLTKEQLKVCKAKGAIIDEDPTASASQSTTSPSPPPQSNDVQTPSAQGSLPPPDTDRSGAAAPKQNLEL